MDSLPKPELAKYETEYVKLTDGQWHEVLLEFVKERESEQFKKWEMLFRVLKHRVGESAFIEYTPPKTFNTAAREFAVLAIEAAANGQPAFWSKVLYKNGQWVLAPSTQPSPVPSNVVEQAIGGK